MKNKNIYTSAIFSLYTQIIIGILCLIGFFISLETNDTVLYSLLTMETVVQVIELCFYIWLISNISSINYDMTFIRYFDWFLTTPTMLISLIIFMIYITSQEKIEFNEVIVDNKENMITVIVLNALMLIFGLLGELQILPVLVSFLIGMLFLCSVFYIIFNNYVKNNEKNMLLLTFTFIIWSLYGVAFLLPFEKKNIMYNILDIFSKNINGLLLVSYMLYVGSLQ